MPSSTQPKLIVNTLPCLCKVTLSLLSYILKVCAAWCPIPTFTVHMWQIWLAASTIIHFFHFLSSYIHTYAARLQRESLLLANYLLRMEADEKFSSVSQRVALRQFGLGPFFSLTAAVYHFVCLIVTIPALTLFVFHISYFLPSSSVHSFSCTHLYC